MPKISRILFGVPELTGKAVRGFIEIIFAGKPNIPVIAKVTAVLLIQK